MRIIVHFGMGKTGSTSIQKTLYQNRSINICYPDFGSYAHNAALVAGFCGQENPPTKADNFALAKIKSVLAESASKNRDVLLSAELLPAFSFSELKALHTVLAEYTTKIIAVGYIRPPKAYIESAFQEALKAGKVTSFDIEKAFFQENAANEKAVRFADLRVFQYKKFFENFDPIFGRKNVHFWKFDPTTFPDGCVVTDFCKRLKIKVSPDAIVRANDGVTLEAVSLLYAYSKYRQELKLEVPDGIKLRFSLKLPEHYQSKKLRFGSNLIAPILEKNQQQIKWMETRMKTSLAEDIFKDDKDAIHSEAELLAFSPEITKWLAEELGDSYVERWQPQMAPQEVAEWVHDLRLVLAKHQRLLKKRTSELLELIKKSSPNLDDLSDEQALSLVREIFKQIANAISSLEEGTLVVAGLGRFEVHKLKRQNKQGEKVTKKRIIFMPLKQKQVAMLPSKRKATLAN